MKALSIMQPWASLIVGGPRSPGVKATENRCEAVAKWAQRLVGQRIAIHASQRRDGVAFADMRYALTFPASPYFYSIRAGEVPYAEDREFPSGAVIGVATLGRVFGPRDVPLTADERRFYLGGDKFGLRFDGARCFDPVPCKGALGFWTVPEDVERQVHEQLASAATPTEGR